MSFWMRAERIYIHSVSNNTYCTNLEGPIVLSQTLVDQKPRSGGARGCAGWVERVGSRLGSARQQRVDQQGGDEEQAGDGVHGFFPGGRWMGLSWLKNTLRKVYGYRSRRNCQFPVQ